MSNVIVRPSLGAHIFSERNQGRELGEILHLGFSDGLHGRRLSHNVREVVGSVRGDRGFKPVYMPMLTAPDDNTKLRGASVPSFGLTLAHERLHEHLNLCPWSGDCAKVCVLNTGKGAYDSVRRAWLWRTDLFWKYPSTAVMALGYELGQAVRKHGRILFRPDVNSDLSWHKFLPELGTLKGVTVYGYSKNPRILGAYQYLWTIGFNYAYSHNEGSDLVRERILLKNGGKIAVVTDRKKYEPVNRDALRSFFSVDKDVDVVDGDISDQWMLSDRPVIGDLSAKGSARKLIGKSGFVVTVGRG
jgi:hypothetical protein